MLARPWWTAVLLSAAAAPESGWYRGLIGRTATALDTPERYEQNKEIEIDLVHAVAACGVQAEVPYVSLRRFAAPGGVIARLMATEPAGR